MKLFCEICKFFFTCIQREHVHNWIFFLKIKNKKHIVILTYNIFKGKNINGKSNYKLKLLKIIHATIDTM